MEDDIRKKVEKEEEKRNAAAEKKRVQKLQSDSTKIISKVSPIIASLGKARSHKSWTMIPSPMQLKYDRTMEKLEEYKTTAPKRMQDNVQPFIFELKGAEEECKRGTLGFITSSLPCLCQLAPPLQK